MNRRRCKRALSTIVTSAMLLSAVAIMGTMVVTWANMKLGSQEQVVTSERGNIVQKQVLPP